MNTNKTFEIEYSRTANLGNFNSLRITVREQFDDEHYLKSEALKIVRSFVLKELEEEMLQLEAEKQPVDPTRTEKNLPLKREPKEDSTNWKPTRNPTIEWCPGNEASDEDLKRAQDKEDKEIWFLESDTGSGLSIFRKVSK